MNRNPASPNPKPGISVLTEITETTDGERILGRLFFDGTCEFCIAWVDRLRGILQRRGIVVVPFADGARESEMRLLWYDGREFGGADAVVFLSGRIWWAGPLRMAAIVPGVRPLLRRIYRRIAASRHCRNSACRLPPPARNAAEAPSNKHTHPWIGWGVLIFLTSLAWLAGPAIPAEPAWAGDQTLLSQNMPAWLRMWLLAGSLWAGFKTIAWLRAGGWNALGIRTFAFFAWAGMDAGVFIGKKAARILPILGALARTAAGLALLWLAAPAIDSPILRGWLGMTGILLTLHFGLFEIAAAFWNRRGFQVRPIMDAPWRARSLAEFWGDRWNRAFSDVARSTVFRPLVRRFGVAAGTLAGFGFSGLAHELVISAPAGGGYGLPTAYFLLQGAGVVTEKRFALRGSIAGRFFLWGVIAAPAFWLFHPLFMTRVIHPFLETLETVAL